MVNGMPRAPGKKSSAKLEAVQSEDIYEIEDDLVFE
jgi:hypothetical protein